MPVDVPGYAWRLAVVTVTPVVGVAHACSRCSFRPHAFGSIARCKVATKPVRAARANPDSEAPNDPSATV